MEARVTTIWLPPSRLEEAVQFIRDEVVPAMAAQPGQQGIWLFADRPTGTLLSLSLWETTDALAASTFLYQELRAKVGSLFGGPPIDESYAARPPEQETATVRATPRRPEAAATARVARVTTLRGEPARVEELVRQLEAQLAPVLERLAGYLGLYLLVDATLGTARAVALWASAEQLAASEDTVAPLRTQAAAALGARMAPTVAVYEVVAPPAAVG
jgi:hypothetical protein